MRHYAPWIAAVLLGSFLISGCTAKIEPVVVDNNACRLGTEQMNICITNAALQNRWSASSNGQDKVRAVRRNGNLMAKIVISHTADQYRIDYLGSKGMAFGDPKYEQWISDLQNSITQAIAARCDEMGRKNETEALPPEEVELPLEVESVPENLQRIK